MTYRSLRAANGGLYLATSLLVLAACAYALLQGGRPAWQQWLAGAAALTALVWGGYYALLRYQVDALGISRHSFFVTREHILWEELAEATFEEQENMGIARCTLCLRAHHGTTLTLSSDLLALDAILELANELRERGLLPPAPKDTCEEN